MNLNSSVKMGGRFSVRVIDPLTETETAHLVGEGENQILNTANQVLFTGFTGPKPLTIGTSTTPTDVAQTTVLAPLTATVLSESVLPNSTVTFSRNVNNVEEIHATGHSVFRVQVLEDGVVNEIAIDNFCRALITDTESGLPGLPASVDSILEITYEFTLIYQVTRNNPLILEGTANTTDSIDHFTDNSMLFIGVPVILAPEGIYRWDSLLSADNIFQAAENIYATEGQYDSTVAVAADSVVQDIVTDTITRTAVFNTPGETLPAIRSFYFGNSSFGVNYILVESATNNPIGLVLDPTDKLSITTTIEWLHA